MNYAEAQEDEATLTNVLETIEAYIRPKGYPITYRNIIHAMFDNYFADWIGGAGVKPTCEYQGTKWE